MVRHLLWWLALLATPVASAAGLSAAIDQRAIALGEPLQLVVQAGDVDLSEVDLTPLKADFEVFASAASRSETRGHVQSRLEVTLYPLRTGSLLVPALHVMHAQTTPLKVEVISGKGDIPTVELHAWVSPEFPMEREPVVLRLAITDDGAMQWDRPVLPNVANAMLQPFGEQTHPVEGAATPRTLHEFRWRVLPLKAGEVTIVAPMIDAHQFGKRLRFPLPRISLRARATPAYLPLQLPIMRPAIRSTPPTQLRVDQPASWTLDVDAPGLSADGLRSLLAIPAQPAWKFYPPVIETLRDGDQSWLRATLNVVPQRAGPLKLPTLTLPYFDPGSEQLRELRVSAPELTARDPGREQATRVAGLLAALLMIAGLGWAGTKTARRWRRKQAWLKSLDTAADAVSLHTALTHDAPLPIRTLRDWPTHRRTPGTMIDDLERLRFGITPSEIDWLALKTAWREYAVKVPLRLFT